MEIMDIIMKRRSIRKYTSQTLEKETIEKLLQAAMAAPTACNNQPWEFIVVTDDEGLAGIRKDVRSAHYNAPAAFVVCHNPEVGRAPRCDAFWQQDLSAAIENMMIAATGMGLGSVWIGVHPTDKEPVVKGLFAIPGDVDVLGIVYVGFPAEEKESHTKYNAERVFWQKYGES